MAITQRNLSIEGVNEIVKEGQGVISSIDKKQRIDDTINRLISLIDDLEKKELEMLQRLGYRSTKTAADAIQMFKFDVSAKYNEMGLNKFVGSDLKEKFIKNYVYNTKKEKDSKIELREQLLNFIKENISITEDMEDSDIKKQIHNIIKPGGLEATVTENGTKLRATYADFIKIDEQGTISYYLDKITPTIEKRLDDIITNPQWAKKYPELKKIGFNKKKHLKKNSGQVDFTLKSEWYDLTKNIETIIDKNPNDPRVKAANQAITELIVREVEGANNQAYVRRLITNMWTANPKMFVIKGNEKNITGILGEISVLAAFKQLFPNLSIEWIAKETSDGTRQVSIDLLITSAAKTYGIQVKNTSISDFDYLRIDFLKDINIDTLFNRLFGEESSPKMEKIKTSLETSHFNFSYNLQEQEGSEGTVAVRGSNDEFDGIEEQLLKLRDDIHLFLFYYAPEMIFADTLGDKGILANLSDKLRSESVTGNTLYMVAGRPFFVSEQLQKIKQQLVSIRNIIEKVQQVEPLEYFKISESGKTIVDYVNDQKSNKKSMALKDISIKLNSSLLFH